MLPDFPLLKDKVLKAINRLAFAEMLSDPLLSEAHHINHHEGNRFEGFSQEGAGEHDYHTAEHDISISTSELISDGISAIVRQVPEIAAAMANQAKKGMFSTFEKAAEVSGNVISPIEGEPTPEYVLAIYEKMSLDFDTRGSPKLDSIVIVSNKPEAVRRARERMMSDPGYRRQFEELIEKKRTEWHNRESSRRLVD
jgi:hypothetical protein